MKQRFYLYQRRGMYYLQDTRTGKQQSLETRDRNTAVRLLELKRQTASDPSYKQFILKTCLASQDPLMGKRTWQTVMDQIQTHGKESSRVRYTVLGCLIIGVLNNGLVLLEVSPFWQQVIKGLVISVAAAVDKMGSRNLWNVGLLGGFQNR